MTTDAVLELRLTGEDVVPGAVRSKDLAEIIASAEDMIASVVVRDDPTLNKEEVVLGLFKIDEGSVALRFKTPLREPVLAAASVIARSIEENDYEDLPDSTRNSLGLIYGFSRRRNCGMELYSLDGRRQRLAVITPQKTIEPVPLITGFTTIYGRVVRVGGVTPKVMVDLPSGETLYCDVEIDLAKKLGKKLYVWVGLRGTGKWSSRDLSLREFRVEDVTQFEDTPISEAIAKLSEMVGPYFTDVEDVEGHVAALRGKELR